MRLGDVCMFIRGKGEREINSVEDWFAFSSPAKGRAQWKEYRSAKELAKSWCRSGKVQVPEELADFLQSHSITKGLKVSEVYPEKETPLDAFKNGRKHDLLLIAEISDKKIIISIEAKADESYGEKIEKYLSKIVNPNSNLPVRVTELSHSVFGEKTSSHLRYQLLHGVAGTLIEAKLKNAAYAIFLVHEFQSNHVNPRNLERNKYDLNKFVSHLIEKDISIEPNDLIGPVTVPGGAFVPCDIPLYIGKVVTVLD